MTDTVKNRLSERGLNAAREAYQQARREVEYFGASEDFTRSPLEAAIDAYLSNIGFVGLMDITRQLLEHYPRDLMEGMAEDPGPRLALALRDCEEAMK